MQCDRQVVRFLVACAVVLSSWACGEPTVSYDVTMPAEFAAHGKTYASCLARCDVARRGDHCKGDSSTLELGSNPCDVACGIMVAAAIDSGCPAATAAVWDCEAKQKWGCASATDDPKPFSPTACASQSVALDKCIANGGPLDGPPLTLDAACTARCAEEGKLCASSDAQCAAKCKEKTSLDLPVQCTLTAAVVVKCQAKNLACASGVPQYEKCEPETKALDDCTRKYVATSVGAQQCLDGCATIGKTAGCATYANNSCLKQCKTMSKEPKICETASQQYWACATAPGHASCQDDSGTIASCGNEQTTLATCLNKCTDGKCTCAPTTSICVGDKIMQCNAEGKGQTLVQDCTVAKGTCKDAACVGGLTCKNLGQASCDGSKVIYCDANGVPSVEKDCADQFETVCNQGTCVKTCKVGDTICKNGTIATCQPDGFSLVATKQCTGIVSPCESLSCVDGAKDCTTVTIGDGTFCDDADLCTVNSTCLGNKCAGTTLTCDDNKTCTADSCEKLKGCVHLPNDATCSDGNSCTKDTCSLFQGCVTVPVAATPCDDGNACTADDKCIGPTCTAGPAKCDDANPCTVDLCEAATGTCSNNPVPQGASCDDGLMCTKGDACNGLGACSSTTPLNCDDGNPCTADSCAEPKGCAYTTNAVPIACGSGLACLGDKCSPAGVCGDGLINGVGEQCDDKNTKNGDGCSAACALEAFKSCALLQQAFPTLLSGMYLIDSDGPGPITVLKLYCDLTTTKPWTLVANIYDTAGDDVPNLPQDVTNGWQQAAGGGWEPVAQVAREITPTASAAVSLNFVAAMAAFGTQNIKVCFVDKAGKDGACVQSPTFLGLAGMTCGNELLSPYSDNKLAWTYGRLVGLPATANSYDPAQLKLGAGCVTVDAGKIYEFGEVCAGPAGGGLCEAVGPDGWNGVWCGHCNGSCFRPDGVTDDELGAGKWGAVPAVNNPSSGSWGFRVYVGP